MNKTKKQIILFMIIVLIGIGYAINLYIIVPEKLLIQQKAKQAQADTQKLALLKSKRAEAVKLEAEVGKLKQATASIGDVTVKKIDTPQLIFDFYSSCKKYGVKGEDLVFQLADSSTKTATPQNGATATPSGTANQSGTASPNGTAITPPSGTNTQTGTTSPGSTTNQQAVPQPNASTNSTSDINKSKSDTNLSKLTIELKVSGNKNKVEKYIRSLNTLTSRKINVKSIKLEATIAQVINDATGSGAVTNTPTIPNNIISPGAIVAKPLTDQVTADIIFNQYIYGDSNNTKSPIDYSFYDGNTGFSSFSDMFK